MTAVTASPYDVVVLTETWLDDVIPSQMLFGDNFVVYRGDRTAFTSNKKRSGGVLIAVRKNIPSSSFTVNEPHLEHAWVSISVGRRKICVGAIYIPPDKSGDVRVIKRHTDCLESVVSNTNAEDMIVVFGDYNLPGLKWISSDDGFCIVDVDISTITRSGTVLLDGINSCNLQQINSLPNRHGNILDLSFVSDVTDGAFTLDSIIDPLVAIDECHPPFMVTLRCSFPTRYANDDHDLQGYNFAKTDFARLSALLNEIDWSPIINCLDVDNAVHAFTATVRHAITQCVPLNRPPMKPPWSNSELRRRKRHCKLAHRTFRRSRSLLDKVAFHTASRRYRYLNGQLYRKYSSSIERNLKRNPKSFWKFVNSKRKETGLPTSLSLDQTVVNTSSEKCELFAEFFRSVFEVTPANEDAADPLDFTPSNVIELDTFEVSSDEFAKAVKKLKSSNSPGPDGIPACVIKKCSAQLMNPLLHIFNLSMSSAKFPTDWKSSYMFPVYKKGSKTDVRCYRGITSLCACSKLLEIIVSGFMFDRTKGHISTNQHGFYPGRSVTTNVTEFTSICLRNIGQGKQVDAVYTDLKAAFDRVDHSILLAKLRKMGSSENFVRWLESYLCNRALAVKIGSSTSNWFCNASGVPQGSNLGPLLFSLYINDATLLLENGCYFVYADDTKIYVIVDNEDDCRRLQDTLDKFVLWCRANNMILSVPKCLVISFHRKKNPLQFEYAINGTTLTREQTVRDLGIVLDSNLTFRNHHEEIIAKARRQLGFIGKVTKEFKDPHTMKSLYVALVRPILETGSIIWDPFHITVIDRIEAVQRKLVRSALRNLPWNDPINLPPYEDRCQLLGLETLKKRRKDAKAVFAAKLLNGELDAPNLLALLDINIPGYALRTSEFFRLPHWRQDYNGNEPVRSIMRSFNAVFNLFDFNQTSAQFRTRLRRMTV